MDPFSNKRVAILGATGYIGRSLVAALHEGGVAVTPFSRDAVRAETIFKTYGIPAPASKTYDVFQSESYDVVINAAGIGSPSKLREDPQAVFAATEFMDALLISYLEKQPHTRVFNLSSGAIYGSAAGEPIEDETKAVFNPSALRSGDCYALAKLSSEARHRASTEFSIVDLRVFSYFSRYLDTTETFLLSEIVARVDDGAVFGTNTDDIVRDFTTANGLLDTIGFLLQSEPENTAYDIASADPVTKFALLDYFKSTWGLKIEMTGDIASSPTGKKHTYCSRSTKLSERGYVPKETSLQAIDREMKARMAS